MATPILATKLYIPPPRPKVVLRPRLFERLNQGLAAGHKLTVVSAPAGFGKTTLVSEWINQKDAGSTPQTKDEALLLLHPSAFILHPSKVAWLALDSADADPTRFLTYLVVAAQTIAANIGHGLLDVLQASQPPPTESILTALLNEIAAIPVDFVLVLDDYHVLDAKPVDDALTFLLEHLPPQMHLVITTREDPHLSLARYRARGQLTELRAADLRFTAAEAAEFLNPVMGLALSAEDVAALEVRTEGWIAGLQLAAIAMQGHPDTHRFIQSFAGGHHFVLDYLLEEVLQRQPERIQTFLLRTSILDRLCGPLCDAVLLNASTSGQATLELFERANLLVVALDDQREWYRYHYLFAEVLQARLMRDQPAQVADLHLRACAWCEQNNLRSEAIRHALAARDFEQAANLIELERSAKSGTYFRSATWLGWVQSLPDELVRTRPRLSVGLAWELLFLGELEAADARMLDADRLLAPTARIPDRSETPAAHLALMSDEESRSLRASLAIGRAFHAQALGDVDGTANHARQALALIPETDHYTRELAGAQLGLACWSHGDLAAAYACMADAMTGLRQTGTLPFANSCAYVMANIRIAQGRLFDAASIYDEALRLATAPGEPFAPGTADMVLGLSQLYREQGNVEAARQYLLRSEALGKQAALPDWSYGLYLAQAQAREDDGDLDGALELLDAAERLYHRTPVPNVHPAAALKTRVWIREGRLAEALAWVQRGELSIDDDLSYQREFEHVTLARVLIARYASDRLDISLHEAVGLLERLQKAAEDGGRMGSVIEIQVLLALANAAQGNTRPALGALERALALAEPQGYIRVFVAEGNPMAELLTSLDTARASGRPGVSKPVQRYVQRLLTILGDPKRTESVTANSQSPVEPLSERERDVLRLLGTELTGPDIARELQVSLNTLRTHTKNIYSKLGVNSRRAAVRQAEELDLR